MRFLLRARESMTAEQRWTAGVALVLSMAVLLFGHPGLPVVVHRTGPPAAATGRGEAGSGRDAGFPLATDAVAAAGPGLDVFPPPPATPSAGAGTSGPISGPSGPVDIVALVAPGGVPGRDDTTAAGVFLDVEVFLADPASCEQVARAADIAVAGLDVDDGLLRCLAGRGVTVLAFDDGGTGERLVSTRRGAVPALGDAVRWGLASGALDGRVGLVASASLRGALERAAPAWRRAGLDLVATAFVDDAATAPETTEVRRLVADGVDVVLFALGAQPAGRWAIQHSVLDPAVRFVVGDAFDALWSEAYPPVLDGALALTSLRVPWSAREDGETGLQSGCRQTWEAAVVPPVLLPGEETVRVYAWCQHAALVEAVAAATELTRLQRSSPLTSDLGPLPDSGWGPRQDAVVSWSAACTCWEPHAPFADRPT